jgi:hypothetical protein
MDSIIKEDISFIQLFKEFVANQMEAYNYNRKWIIKIKSCSIKSIYYRLASEIRLKKRRSFNIPFIKGVIHLEDDQINILIL